MYLKRDHAKESVGDTHKCEKSNFCPNVAVFLHTTARRVESSRVEASRAYSSRDTRREGEREKRRVILLSFSLAIRGE